MEYFVASNLSHDGKAYQRGDTISLDDAAATAELLNIGVIQTTPIGEAPSPAPELAEPPVGTGHEPAVAGKPMDTGEPSVDGREGERTHDNAEEVTLGAFREPTDGMRALSPDVRSGAPNAPQTGSDAPVEPTTEMTRVELENLAFAEGVNRVDVDHAPNKAALIDLILANRAAKAAPQEGTAEHDPSANL